MKNKSLRKLLQQVHEYNDDQSDFKIVELDLLNQSFMGACNDTCQNDQCSGGDNNINCCNDDCSSTSNTNCTNYNCNEM